MTHKFHLNLIIIIQKSYSLFQVKVHLKLSLGEEAHYYPRKYFYWSDSGDHGQVREQEGQLETFSVKKTSKHIYIFGYYEIR